MKIRNCKYQRFKHELDSSSIVQQYLEKTATSISELSGLNKNYVMTDNKFWDTINENGFDIGMDIVCSKCSIEKQSKDPSNHINYWTIEKTYKYLTKAGFCNIYESRFGQSKMLPLRNIRYFDNTHPEMSFYIEAIK